MSETGESFTGGDEWATDDDFKWFDLEWDKWKDDPTMQPDYESDMIQWRARMDQAETILFEELDARDIDRLIDKDPMQRHALCQNFMYTRHEMRLEEMKRTVRGVRMYVNDDHHIKAAYTNAMTYRELYKFQEQVVTDAATMWCLHIGLQEEGNGTWQLDLESFKQKNQATYLVHYMRPLHDRWQVFFNEMIPGESLDTETRDGEWLISEVLEGQSEFGDELAKDRRALRQAMNIAGVREAKSDMNAVLRLTVIAVEMQNIATAPYQTNRATRNERLYDYGRQYGLDEEVLSKLAKYYDEQYPIN